MSFEQWMNCLFTSYVYYLYYCKVNIILTLDYNTGGVAGETGENVYFSH